MKEQLMKLPLQKLQEMLAENINNTTLDPTITYTTKDYSPVSNKIENLSEYTSENVFVL